MSARACAVPGGAPAPPVAGRPVAAAPLPRILAGLVPAKGKLTYHLVTGGDGKVSDTKRTFTRKDIAAGKLVNPPGCHFIETRPDCAPPDATSGAVQCSCHGGGYHVTYDWKREGDAMVIVKIDESDG